MNKGSSGGRPGPFDHWVLQVNRRIEKTLGAMLERVVALTPRPLAKVSQTDLEKLLPDGPIAITIPFGPAGSWAVLLSRRLASALADLASMGAGAAEWNEDVHPGAIAEIWGQVIADLEPDIVQQVGDEARVGEIEVTSQSDTVVSSMGGEPAVLWKITISDWGEADFAMLVSAPFAAAFAGQHPEAEPEPGPPSPDSSRSSRQTPPHGKGPVAQSAEFEEFDSPRSHPGETPRNLDTLLDISLPITIELGRTKMLIRDVLDLGPGSVIELDKMSGEPVDLFVNDKRFAKGEVVVIEENFGVRIIELLKVDERIKALS